MRNIKNAIITLLILLGVFLFSGCGNELEEIDIYASIYPVEFLVNEIVRDNYSVKRIYPLGHNVHDYEAPPSKIISLSKSKLIFYIGLNLEAVIDQHLDSVLYNVPTISLSDNLELIELNSEDCQANHAHNKEGVFFDPHVWLDPISMQIMAETILENIIVHMGLAPEGDKARELTENCNQLKVRLQDLHEDYLESLNNELIINKTIVVDHDAYAYWKLRYGINRIRLRNHNDGIDISPSDLSAKIDAAKAAGIKYVCTTKNEAVSPIIKTFLNNLDLSDNATKPLHHIGTITAEEAKGEDYFSLMYYNLSVLKEVLPQEDYS